MVSFQKVAIHLSELILIGNIYGAYADEAPRNDDNPDVKYKAHLDTEELHGIVEFYRGKNGTAKVHVDITGLPEEGGPFYYHIHNNRIPENGDCEMAGTHFNPYDATLADCDEQDGDANCQVGDLSGKHGVMNTTCFQLTYYDPYISLDPNNKAFIGDRSVVVHFNDMSKMVCSNIFKSGTRRKTFWKKDSGEDQEDYFNLNGAQDEVEEDEEENQNVDGTTLIPTITSSAPRNLTTGISISNGTANNTSEDDGEDEDDGEAEISTTYSDNAIQKIASGLVGTIISLLISIF